jgi:hypothetical protein
MVAGFISERWPASNRNPGRLHVGTPGRIKSESALEFFERSGRIRKIGVLNQKFNGKIFASHRRSVVGQPANMQNQMLDEQEI